MSSFDANQYINNVLTIKTVQISPFRTLMTALKDILLETNISFQNINRLICHGSVLVERSNLSEVYIITNRRLYYLFTQVFLVFFAYLFTVFFKVSIFRFAYFMLLTALSLQLLFNLNFGLNIFNQIFLNTYLFCILFKLIYDKK